VVSVPGAKAATEFQRRVVGKRLNTFLAGLLRLLITRNPWMDSSLIVTSNDSKLTMASFETFDRVDGERVLDCRPPTHMGRVLVPVDFSASTPKVLEYAESIAVRLEAALQVLHVVQLNIAGEERGIPRLALVQSLTDDARRELHRLIAKYHFGDLIVTIRVREGRPHEAIVEEAYETGAEMIIMGARTRPGIAGLLGRSTLARVIRRAPCPVLAVRSDGRAARSFLGFAPARSVPRANGEHLQPSCI
jgi:nucleotide-binding universal stress UspA family protein